MLYLSVSALKDYLLCPKIYWYRVNKKGTFIPNEYIIRGNVVHSAIEKYSTFDAALDYILHYYKTDKAYCDTVVPKEILVMLGKYYDDIEPTLPVRRVEDIEKTFKIRWSDNMYLIGKMDRIGDNAIYDWKTTIKKPSVYELQDMQFYIYWWAYQQLFNKKPQVYYGHLYEGKLLPIDIHEDMWYNIKQLINDVSTKLSENRTFFPRLFGYKCKSCFYKGACWSDYELGD